MNGCGSVAAAMMNGGSEHMEVKGLINQRLEKSIRKKTQVFSASDYNQDPY